LNALLYGCIDGLKLCPPPGLLSPPRTSHSLTPACCPSSGASAHSSLDRVCRRDEMSPLQVLDLRTGVTTAVPLGECLPILHALICSQPYHPYETYLLARRCRFPSADSLSYFSWRSCRHLHQRLHRRLHRWLHVSSNASVDLTYLQSLAPADPLFGRTNPALTSLAQLVHTDSDVGCTAYFSKYVVAPLYNMIVDIATPPGCTHAALVLLAPPPPNTHTPTHALWAATQEGGA